MKRYLHHYIAAAVVFSLVVGAVPSTWAMSPVLSPGLNQLLADAKGSPDSLIDVVVFLDGGNLTEDISRSAGLGLTRHELIRQVTSELRAYQAPHADLVRRFLQAYSSQPVKEYWIAPAMSARLPLSRLESLSSITGLELVVEDAALSFEEPIEVKSSPELATSVSSQLQLLNVPSLWAQGLTGAGRLVANFDTGVDQAHPSLASKWRGNHTEVSAAWFSKVTPDDNPTDKIGHGTHTMGVMVGSVDADTIGVAPDAEWISAGVIDQGRDLATTISDIIEAFQWALDPDGDSTTTDDVPDVILNSWGIPKGLFAPCDLTFATVVSNVEAAGIVAIFAAGNEGPGPASLRNPADMVLSPLTSFAVGAVDNSSQIASFSSRGPSSCDDTEIKPEIVAPGVSVRSASKNGEYKVLTGTSMAAPFIAGLVALMRQYNPNATVAQIKNALIASATDLGPEGEDNAYGHGLVDASALIEHLPLPVEPAFALDGMQISDDDIASPGETFELGLTVVSTVAVNGTIAARLETAYIAGVIILSDQSSFFFGGGSNLATAVDPFVISLSPNLPNGLEVPMALILEPAGFPPDTVEFSLTVGVTPAGTFATHTTDQMVLTVSDFAQYGLAPGSIYDTQGDGFRIQGSDNLLYEAGIMMGSDGASLSTSVRDSLGAYAPSEFSPIAQLSDEFAGSPNGIHRVATFADATGDQGSLLVVRQETISYPNLDNNGLLILRYHLVNNADNDVHGTGFGLLIDFDLTDGSDQVVWDAEAELLYQHSATGPMVGLIGLTNLVSFRAIENGSGKTGFTDTELSQFILSPWYTGVDEAMVGDWMFVIGSGRLIVPAHDSIEIALALVGSNSLQGLYANTDMARELYGVATSITDTDETDLPHDFVLFQNYPNPFNPTTSIAFDLSGAGRVSLEVYNLLGRHVKTIYDGELEVGTHRFEWGGTNQHNEPVATGMYFYRLTTPERSVTRKMLLLK